MVLGLPPAVGCRLFLSLGQGFRGGFCVLFDAGGLAEGAANAESAWVSGDLVGEDANVVDDRPQLAGYPFDVHNGPIQVLIQLGIVHQLAKRTFSVVYRTREEGKLPDELVELVEARFDGHYQRRATLSERLGEPLQIV